MFKHSGILHYSGAYRLVVDIDPELGSYYRALLPKWFPCIPQRHAPHITVVRPGKDVPANLAAWGKYEGEKIDFFYEPGIDFEKVYYYLRVCSQRLEAIRLELGLPVVPWFDAATGTFVKPPAPFVKYFHSTIGNCK